MKYEIEEEEEINNIRNKNGLLDYKKLMRKIGFKERGINSELVKRLTFSSMIWEMYWKILKGQKLIQKEIKFR